MSYVFRDRRGNAPRWAIAYAGTDGRLRRERVDVPTKELAKQTLAKRLTEVAQARVAGVRSINPITLRGIVDEYLNHARATNRESSAKRDEVSLQRLLPRFGRYRLMDITPGMVRKYVDDRTTEATRRKKPPAPATINRELSCLSAIFREAVLRQYVESNPVRLVGKLKEENVIVRYLSDEEEKRLLAFCPDHLTPLVMAALHTGMRRGELFHLTWADVDFEERLITVRNTKSHRTRHIPMNEAVYGALEALPRYIVPPKAQGDAPEACPYVFANPETKQPWVDLKLAWLKAVRQAGIKRFRFHDLRHTFASRLAQRGVSIKVIQDLLGHQSLATTLRYAHLGPSDLREAVKVLTQNPKITTHRTTHATDSPSVELQVVVA